MRLTKVKKIKLTTIIENNKWLPVNFMLVTHVIPKDFIDGLKTNAISLKNNIVENERLSCNVIEKYSVLGRERYKRTYTLWAEKRGCYTLRNIKVVIGDIFGLHSQIKEFDDYIEILIYPKVMSFSDFNLETTSLLGDSLIRRWIYKDPLYIRGVREYSVEDRMKDIHWKSSLKMNKLMVKEYDYTSERELMIIVNVQYGEPYWGSINSEMVENSINFSVSLANEVLKHGTAVGMWTNAHLKGDICNNREQGKASLKSFKSILELCSRMDYISMVSFEDFLNSKIKMFDTKCTYVVVAAFLSIQSLGILQKLRNAGFIIKIIDMSDDGKLPTLNGIEVIRYKGVQK